MSVCPPSVEPFSNCFVCIWLGMRVYFLGETVPSFCKGVISPEAKTWKRFLGLCGQGAVLVDGQGPVLVDGQGPGSSRTEVSSWVSQAHLALQTPWGICSASPWLLRGALEQCSPNWGFSSSLGFACHCVYLGYLALQNWQLLQSLLRPSWIPAAHFLN